MQFVENSKKALEALERKNMKQSESNQVGKIHKLATSYFSFKVLVQERKNSITMVDIEY